MLDENAVTELAIGWFIEGDHHACLRELARIRLTVSSQWQMVIIGLQRLGLAEEVADVAQRVLSRPDEYPWEHRLFELTLGKADPEDVLAAANSAEQLAEALWATGE